MPEEKSTSNEMHKALFANLVMMLGSSAMQQLGKLANPLNNKTEVNLEGAQVTIDMLEMLESKTSGNLDEDESKMLTDLIGSLQMNYVETSQSAGKKEPEKAEADKAAGDKTASGESGEKQAETGENPPVGKEGTGKKDPRFHKSYGA